MGSSTRSTMMAKLNLVLSVCMGIPYVDQQSTSSMMMAEPNLGRGHLISRPAADLLHDDGRAQSWALHDHGHLISRPAADLFHDDGRAQYWALHGHGHPISRPAANLLHDDGTPSWSPPCSIATFFLTFFLRGWTATEGCRVVCLIQARLYQMIVRSVCTVSCPSCGSVLSKTAIFPKKEGRKREIFNESARGSSLREANVYVRAKDALHDGPGTVQTLRTVIWYKRACIRQTTQ